jgi:PTH1 family peptidyl-tRNA hydrolase
MKSVTIVYPELFMNLSGKAVVSLLGGMKDKVPNLLVIVDDLETKLGSCKLVFEGGTRGHNGLRSIHQSLGTKAFYQLRIGIGRPESDNDVSDFVLSRFKPEEKIDIDSIQKEVFHLIQQWIEERLETK